MLLALSTFVLCHWIICSKAISLFGHGDFGWNGLGGRSTDLGILEDAFLLCWLLESPVTLSSLYDLKAEVSRQNLLHHVFAK